MSYITVDIDINEVLEGMTVSEKQRLAEDLYDSGYVPQKLEKLRKKEMFHVAESEYQDALKKLDKKWNRLTLEEEALIINISKRF